MVLLGECGQKTQIGIPAVFVGSLSNWVEAGYRGSPGTVSNAGGHASLGRRTRVFDRLCPFDGFQPNVGVEVVDAEGGGLDAHLGKTLANLG